MDWRHSRPRVLYTGPSAWRLLFLLLAVTTATARSSTSEIYLNGTTTALVSGSSTFPPTSRQDYHLGLSFRTCRQLLLQNMNNNNAVLLSQTASNGDRLSVELLRQSGNSNGAIRLRFSLSVDSTGYSSDSAGGTDLADNQWHDVDLRFHDRQLQWRLDGAASSNEWNPLANASDVERSPLFRRSVGDNSIHRQSITLGRDYTGCLLQGPSVRFDSLDNAEDLFLGQCPIPQHGNCSSGNRIDPCWARPCLNDGRCVTTGDNSGFECVCTRRFVGDRCQHDLGSLCDRPENGCLNGGTCLEQVSGNGTTCLCPHDFTGSLCESRVRLPRCQINTCLNNATCFVSNGVNQCVCNPGYEGPRCETDIDECNPQPCKNGGTCIDGQGSEGFTCDCEGTGFQGERCQQKVNHCSSDPCQHGGNCFDRYTTPGYVCQCSGSFTGTNCEVEMSSRITLDSSSADQQRTSCETDSCLNGGICSSSINNQIECLCLEGFSGPRCEQVISSTISSSSTSSRNAAVSVSSMTSCMSNPCQNNGSCTDLIDGGYDCLCSPGFGGPDCSVSVDLSSSLNAGCSAAAPCLNGGSCTTQNGTSVCQCPNGFEGDRCQVDLDECASNPCIHSRTCTDLIADYRCTCSPGWTGKNCDIDIDECASEPCRNNGTCTNELNGRFLCECPTGFSGERCEVNRDDCPEAACLNNGTCVDGINNYTCSCPPQFAGRHCEEEYDACASGPCQNGASCITTRPQHTFYCECLPGFEGMYCENDIDECVSIQCADGKVCFDLINRYECRCPVGFTGPQCRENINECAPNATGQPICQNGGTCIDGIGNYTCSCPPGFTGRNCTEDIDECEVLRPCVYGICQNSFGSYQCYCRPGFSGDNCNLEFDECLSHPCQNNGTCNNLINGYECVCAPGFTGKDCDININECESSPCQNNGTCIDGIAAFSCVCLPGFTGPRCEININECDSSPCLNEGLCIDGINSYHCDCNDTGFTGDHCQINVDDCLTAPCLHGSQCVDLIKDYRCECHSGYRGKNCEQDINECTEAEVEGLPETSTQGPCLNGAECFERSNRSLYEPGGIFHNEGPFSYNTSGGYLCRCIPGFEGQNCQINIDECALAAASASPSSSTGPGSSSAPCKFGTCVDGINNYTCSCFPGYEGDDCETEIDECLRHEPCQNGASCVDRVADYTCICPPNYGGKNCSVQLLGCIDVSCLHGGTCQPYLEDETVHRFTCQCPFGFHGQLCQHATTMSFNGSAFMPVQTNRDEGYDLSFRFRTTLPSGLLAVGQGQTYYRLELLDGQLNLHSSLLNKWEGVFLGSNLNDAEWQSVRVRFNFTHLHLGVNQQEATYPINPVESINSTETSFGMTVLGGATSFLRILAQGLPFFIGCMENVVVNGQWVIPSNSPAAAQQAQAIGSNEQMLHLAGIGVEMGCPRVDHCRPNPCQNAGTCNDLWTFFNCSCQRPFLGDTCQFSYKAATFGHENVTSPANSLVSVSITPQERLALSNSMDISMFVRTRESSGLIFYLGTPPADSGGPSYIAAELQAGRLLVVADLGDGEQLFPVEETPMLNDGNSHLIQVIRDRLQLRVKINDTTYLNDSLTSFRPLQAQVLFLGGLPPSARLRRQTTFASQLAAGGVSSTQSSVPNNNNNALEGRNFKGILQDIQIKSGNITRIVEIFPLDSREELALPDTLGTVQRSNDVLEGVVSDNSCRSDPCVNGGNCTVTWNDFLCVCPSGFKGKTCSELEFCAIHTCPAGGTCQNLNDGYECLTSATFNGVNSTVQYSYSGSGPLPAGTIQFSFRSRQGGTVAIIQNESRGAIKFLRIDVEQQGIMTRWIGRDGMALNESLHELVDALDGSWHTVTLNLTAILGAGSTNASTLLADLVAGHIMLGGSGTIHSIAERDVQDLDSTTVSPSEGVLTPATLILPAPTHYRGCLNEVRIGGLLLPFFPATELLDDPSARKFRPSSELDELERGVCRVCYDHECQNGAMCLDPMANFTCACLPGYEGDLCQVNIDECIGNACNLANSIRCVDGVANYTCQCQTGWTGWLCDEDINECDPDPCQNNGTCENLVGRYECNCTEDYVGVDCERPRVVTCANDPCLNGANCTDTFDPSVSDQAVNYTCSCPFGYEGINCQLEIDYCLVLDPCRNGANCFRVTFEPGYICECAEGFTGDHCEVDINECQQRPCLNGGRCIDGVNNFTCDCSNTGYEGYLCEVDVDECSGGNNPCVRGRCLNSPGSYACLCDSDDDCGRHCDRKDPCKISPFGNENDTVCYNGATCTAFCDDPLDLMTGFPVYRCSCLDGFEGNNCSLAITTRLEPNLKLVAIIVPIVAALLLIAVIGSVVFFMMARNKRATRGTYSPSRQEMFSPRVEMGQVMKPPPEERLI